MKPFWPPKYSVTLSLVVTYTGAAALLVLMFFAQRVIESVLGLPAPFSRNLAWIFYACCPAGWTAIAALLKLLHNIRVGEVFTRQNATLLRLLSWCFAFTALVSFVTVYWFPSLLIIGTAAGFLALILRVVKNVIAQATLLREENDLTI